MADPNANGLIDPSMTGGSFVNPAYATPNQKAMLYAYANELMKPQAIHNGWQGLASIANALVGGYMGHQADVQEQASRAADQRSYMSNPSAGAPSPDQPPQSAAPGPRPVVGSAPNSPPVSPLDLAATIPVPPSLGGAASVAAPSPSNYPQTTAGAAQFIKDYSAYRAPGLAAHGIPPTLPIGVAGAEGLNAYSPNNPNGASAVDIDPQTGKPFSFGDFQLNVRNGLGNEALNAGIDPRDPNQRLAADKFSIDYMAEHGIQPWHGDKAVAAFQNGQPANAMAYAPQGSPASVAPAISAIGAPQGGQPQAAPFAGHPMQVAQNGGSLPLSPGQLAYISANPNATPEMRAMAMHLMQPNPVTDALGNTSPMYQGAAVGAPIFHGGVLRDQNSGSLPAVLSGSPGAPTNTVAPPVGAGSSGASGNPADMFGPLGILGQMRAGQAATEAAAAATTAKSAAAQTRFQKTQEAGPALLSQAYPLRQVQAILDKNGGNIPTGQGAENVQGAASLVNMVATTLGHPLTGEDSRLTSMELLHKYGTQIAASQAQALGLPNTNMGQETAAGVAPGTGLSQPADAHLVDNLIRLNALAQKKNTFEHNYYLKNGQSPNAYDNFTQDWQNEISGPKAVPLSKFGRDKKADGSPLTLKDGFTPAIWVPSTDPSGFSLFRKNDPAFDASAMTPEAK